MCEYKRECSVSEWVCVCGMCGSECVCVCVFVACVGQRVCMRVCVCGMCGSESVYACVCVCAWV